MSTEHTGLTLKLKMSFYLLLHQKFDFPTHYTAKRQTLFKSRVKKFQSFFLKINEERLVGRNKNHKLFNATHKNM